MHQAWLAVGLLCACSLGVPDEAHAERPVMVLAGGGISPWGAEWFREGSVKTRHVTSGPRAHAGVGLRLGSHVDLHLVFGVSGRVSTRLPQDEPGVLLPIPVPTWKRFFDQAPARLFDLAVHPSYRWPLRPHLDAAIRVPLGGFAGRTPGEPSLRVEHRTGRLRGLFLGLLGELHIVPKRAGLFSLRVHVGATLHHGWQDVSHEVRGDDARVIEARRTLTLLSPVLGLTVAFGKGAAHD